jgi:hypothetical protein
LILLANSRQRSIDRNMGKMGAAEKENPRFQELQPNSPAGSKVRKNPDSPIGITIYPQTWKTRCKRPSRAAISPRSMRRWRKPPASSEIKLGHRPSPPTRSQTRPDPVLGCMRADAELMDEIVTDAYRHRREETWRDIDL